MWDRGCSWRLASTQSEPPSFHGTVQLNPGVNKILVLGFLWVTVTDKKSFHSKALTPDFTARDFMVISIENYLFVTLKFHRT